MFSGWITLGIREWYTSTNVMPTTARQEVFFESDTDLKYSTPFSWFIFCFFAPIGNSSFSVCHINPKLSLLLPLVICVGHMVDLGHMAWTCEGFGPPAGPFSYFIFPLALPPKICFLLIQRDSVKVDFYLTVIFQDTLNLKAFYSVFKTEAFPRWRSI